MCNTIATLLLVFALGISSIAGAEVFSGIAAVVNDEVITIRELNREYDMVAIGVEKRDGPLTAEAAGKLRSYVINALVDKALVRQKIKELHIVISDEEIRQSIEEVKRQNRMSQESLETALLAQKITFAQYKVQLKEQLERLRLMSQEVKSKVQVSENEVLSYYNANMASFRSEDAYHARAIFIRLGKDATSEEKKTATARLDAVTAEVKKGADFAELAKKFSDDPNAKKDGGDLGFFKKGEMLPDIEKIVLKLKTGESDMVRTATGYYLIKLEEKRPAVAKTFEEVKAMINENLYRKKSEERFTQWLQELRKGAAIEIKQ